jgi:Icc-related predicted phosphoesterase
VHLTFYTEIEVKMNRRIVLFLVAIFSLYGFGQNAPAVLNAGVNPPFSFDAYGDIRFMNPSDTKDSDPVRRKLIVDKIAEDKPSFLLISGDLVANGGDPRQWEVLDEETTPLRKADIKIYPALGNHDLRGDLPEALSNYFERFPYLQNSRYYTVRAGNVLVVVLDSSLDQPGGEEIQWFDKQIDAVPNDVQFVVIELHHPPITRSHPGVMGGGHSARPQEEDMAKYLESLQQKSRARFVVVAGHVHNYERYEQGGVTFITTGGGGATPYMIQREPGDAYTEPGPTYHFCHFDVAPGKLSMRMEKLDWNGKEARWVVGDSFEIKAK